ncbi:MAG: ATP-binding cassette domain-containing protein [Candidatus Thorarchaeota archaeon]|nr:ATP-binding cassette domain-containing protein [Candidatus Thorarchaeota archaeon]
MIMLEDVHYSYEGIYTALRGVSLQVEQGERLAIMGTNGAGKTTLIKHMNGLLRPMIGRVFVEGTNAASKSVAELSRIVGLVWQNPDHQLFLDSVEKEIVFGLKNLGFSQEDAQERCYKTLSKLGLAGFGDRSPFSLSGGERKRVALASVLAIEPRVLALDEPTIGQDARQKELLARLLEELNEKGCTVIVVTHDIEFVVEHFPRTVAMADGRIVADGPTRSVLSNQSVLDQCSLTVPQLTQTARALHDVFPDVSERCFLLSEVEATIVDILGGL